jgi:aspartyl-tRNA synthetase
VIALFKSTPEGSREFVVPTRQKGKFYSLVQSPQQYKQLLMIGGVDRYFQVARCYRDEGGRSDRQPEFTQLDLEMSFIQREDLIQLIQEMIRRVFEDDSIEFPILSYDDAMSWYGSDKPDLVREMN